MFDELEEAEKKKQDALRAKKKKKVESWMKQQQATRSKVSESKKGQQDGDVEMGDLSKPERRTAGQYFSRVTDYFSSKSDDSLLEGTNLSYSPTLGDRLRHGGLLVKHNVVLPGSLPCVCCGFSSLCSLFVVIGVVLFIVLILGMLLSLATALLLSNKSLLLAAHP